MLFFILGVLAVVTSLLLAVRSARSHFSSERSTLIWLLSVQH
jgi:hypothetical protein